MKEPELKTDQDQDDIGKALGDSGAYDAKGTVSIGLNGEDMLVIAVFGFK